MIDTTSKNCRLSIYKSDFELIINDEGNVAKTCQSAGFQLLMKQVKTNYGIKSGRFMFEVKILRYLEPEEFKGFNATSKNQIISESLKDSKNLVRVGWTTQYAKNSTGVDYDSCGYENSGTRYYAGNYKKYGEAYGPGDVIRCCIDLEGQNKSFSFYKNGQFQGIAYRISNKQNDKAYFPSVNIRNAEVIFNFGNLQEELFPIKQEGTPSIIQPAQILPIQPVQQQPLQQQVYAPLQPQIQPNPYMAPTIPGQQYIVQPNPAQNQYINPLAQQQVLPQGAQIAKQAPYMYGQQAPYQQQPYIHQHQQYPQQPYIQQQQQQQQYGSEPPKQISIPNAQNLVSKEEIKISQYNFVYFAQDDAKEYESVQIQEQYEAIFMVGLPASGKTTFAQGFVKRSPDTILLGSFEIFEHIVNNIQIPQLNQNLTLLMEICNHIMEKSMRLIAKLQKRSVLIDQCNVLLKARLKKLRIFKNFIKKCFVLVVSDSDQRKRMLKRERQILNQCQMYPKLCLESFRNLQEHFVMPTKEEGFTDIQYLEIDEEISQRVALMNNLIAVNEVHPLLKPYDFKRVKAIKEAQEKLKLQQMQQPQQIKLPYPNQQPVISQQSILQPNQGQNKEGNQQQASNQPGQIQFIEQNTAEQQGNQQEQMNVEGEQQEEQNQSQGEEQQEYMENNQHENSQDQEEQEQGQDSNSEEWGYNNNNNNNNNNSNQEDMVNQSQEKGEDEMIEDQQNE